MSWFAIRAKPRRESFAAANICALGLGIVLPRIKIDRLIRGSVQQVIKPMFPGYFFCRFCPEKCLELVKGARGVSQVVSSGRIPIPVDEEVIREIQDRAKEDGFIQIRPQALASGIRVTIQGGPFAGIVGRVERELDDRKRVAIFLETLFQTQDRKIAFFPDDPVMQYSQVFYFKFNLVFLV